MKTTAWIVLTAAAALTGCSHLDRSRDLADANVSGTTLAEQVCSNCHGITGNSVSPAFPRLAGQQSAYIVNQLTNFRSEQRVDPAGYRYMWGLSRNLTDAQIAEFADYYSRQTVEKSDATPIDATTLAAGRQLFEEGVPQDNVLACKICHGPAAEGMASFPRLASQHADYIVKQLEIFKNTQGRPGTPMEGVTHMLTHAQMQEVAAYLEQLPN